MYSGLEGQNTTFHKNTNITENTTFQQTQPHFTKHNNISENTMTLQKNDISPNTTLHKTRHFTKHISQNITFHKT